MIPKPPPTNLKLKNFGKFILIKGINLKKNILVQVLVMKKKSQIF